MIKQEFKVWFRYVDHQEIRVFEFPDEKAFEAAIQLFAWATSFFKEDSFFTSERVGHKPRLCPDDEHATCGPDLDMDIKKW